MSHDEKINKIAAFFNFDTLDGIRFYNAQDQFMNQREVKACLGYKDYNNLTDHMFADFTKRKNQHNVL